MRPASSARETPADVGAATTPGEAIRVRGLRVTRGGRAVLRGVSLTVPAGQITGLLGPGGSGKTTLLRSIMARRSSPTAPSKCSASPQARHRCAGAPDT
jgi:ABC-type Mn2+/Zn2+ transport system ATPase subunit